MQKTTKDAARFLVEEPQVWWRFSEPGDMPPGLFFWADLPVEDVSTPTRIRKHERAPFYTFVFDDSKTPRRLRLRDSDRIYD